MRFRAPGWRSRIYRYLSPVVRRESRDRVISFFISFFNASFDFGEFTKHFQDPTIILTGGTGKATGRERDKYLRHVFLKLHLYFSEVVCAALRSR